MKKQNINLNEEDNSYVVIPSTPVDLPLVSTPEIKEIQDNYFVIDQNLLPLQEVLVEEPSCNSPGYCPPVAPNTNQACISYSEMVKYVNERLKNYIIISTTAPENPVENQLWIQI